MSSNLHIAQLASAASVSATTQSQAAEFLQTTRVALEQSRSVLSARDVTTIEAAIRQTAQCIIAGYY